MNIKDWLQAISTIGFPIFLVLYLLGMLPATRSPIDRVEASIAILSKDITAHEIKGADERREILRMLRNICRNTASVKGQRDCD